MILMVAMVMVSFSTQCPKHSESKQYNQDARKSGQPRLCIRNYVAFAEGKGGDGENPNYDCVSDCGRDAERDRLRSGAPDRHDVGGHKRFGMSGFERMKCAQQDSDRQIKPSIVRGRLNDSG